MIQAEVFVDARGDLVGRIRPAPPNQEVEPIEGRFVIATRDELFRTDYGPASLAFRKVAAAPISTAVEPALNADGMKHVLVLELSVPEADRVREKYGLEPRGRYRVVCGQIKNANVDDIVPVLFLDGARIAKLRWLDQPVELEPDELTKSAASGSVVVISDLDGIVYGVGTVRGSQVRMAASTEPNLLKNASEVCGAFGMGLLDKPLEAASKWEIPVLFFGSDGKVDVRVVPPDVTLRKAAFLIEPGFWINGGLSPVGRLMFHEDCPHLDSDSLMEKLAIDATTEPDYLSAEEARMLAERAKEALKDKVDYVEVVGGLARGHDQVHDIDLLVVPKEPGQKIDLSDISPKIEVFYTSHEDFEPQLMHWILGKAIIHLKRAARERGMKLNRYGLHLPDGTVIRDAEEIYRILGMEMPPHLREAIRRWREHVNRSQSPVSQYLIPLLKRERVVDEAAQSGIWSV